MFKYITICLYRIEFLYLFISYRGISYISNRDLTLIILYFLSSEFLSCRLYCVIKNSIYNCLYSFLMEYIIQKQEIFDYSHVPGRAVLHRGRHRHGARATTSGHRINLLLWCRRFFYYFYIYNQLCSFMKFLSVLTSDL